MNRDIDARPGWKAQAAVFAVLLAVIIVLQFLGGAYSAEPATQGDEAAHVVTGLMVRDYLTTGFGKNPMRFAENYYVHYPQVALGHWPPVFYGVQAIWMLAVPPSRAAVLLLLAFLAAVICFRIFQVVSRHAPWQAAFASALLLAILAPMQQYTRLILAEMLLSLLCLEAVIAFARWMDRPGVINGGVFGLWSAAAILTKATAAGIAFLPVCAILMARRWRLLLKPSLWLAGLIVVALCAPWYLYAPGARHEANIPMGGLVGVASVKEGSAVVETVRFADLRMRLEGALIGGPILLNWLGPAVLLVMLGIWKPLRDRDALAASTLGLLGGFLLFRTIMMAAAAHERLLLPVLPPLVFFLWDGCERLRTRVQPAAVMAACFVIVAGWSLYRAEPKRAYGIQDVAKVVASHPEFRDSVVLLCSDGNTEGAFVAEFAWRDETRPHRFVLRSHKVMASSLWNGQDYKLRTGSAGEVLKMIQEVPVGVLIVDTDPAFPVKHMPLLLETLAAYPDQFHPIDVPAGRFKAYEVEGHRNRPPGKFTMSLQGLGRDLGKN